MFLEISQNSQENTCVRVCFLIKLQARPATLFKKRLWHRCFPVNFVKFLRTTFIIEHLWWLLLLLYVFCLHFLRIHEVYFFRKGFESVRAQFFSENVSGK